MSLTFTLLGDIPNITFKSKQKIDELNRELFFVGQELLKCACELSGFVDLEDTNKRASNFVTYNNELIPSKNALKKSGYTADEAIALIFGYSAKLTLPPKILEYVRNAYKDGKIPANALPNSIAAFKRGQAIFEKLNLYTSLPFFSKIMLMGVFYSVSQWYHGYIEHSFMFYNILREFEPKRDLYKNATEGFFGLFDEKEKRKIINNRDSIGISEKLYSISNRNYTKNIVSSPPSNQFESDGRSFYLRDCGLDSWCKIYAWSLNNLMFRYGKSAYGYVDSLRYIKSDHNKFLTCFAAFLSVYKKNEKLNNSNAFQLVEDINKCINGEDTESSEGDTQKVLPIRDHFATSIYISILMIKWLKKVKKNPKRLSVPKINILTQKEW